MNLTHLHLPKEKRETAPTQRNSVHITQTYKTKKGVSFALGGGKGKQIYKRWLGNDTRGSRPLSRNRDENYIKISHDVIKFEPNGREYQRL